MAPHLAFELAADPNRFAEFNPVVQVPTRSGRVERMGNVYHQVFACGPIRVSTRWETTGVDPANLADRPLPSPPWTTVEVGELPLFGRWVSISRYDAMPTGRLITHDLEYGVPNGPFGRLLDLVAVRPLLSVSCAFLGRRLRAWNEASAG